MKVILCLGSNQDNPASQLDKAIRYLEEKCYIKIIRKGAPVQTKPFGFTDQPDFINQLLEIETPMNPVELLAFIRLSEQELGRKPTFRWGPRTIDIDVIFFGDEIISTDELTVPHPGAAERVYLVQLLNDFIPDYIHPVLKMPVRQIYSNLNKE